MYALVVFKMIDTFSVPPLPPSHSHPLPPLPLTLSLPSLPSLSLSSPPSTLPPSLPLFPPQSPTTTDPEYGYRVRELQEKHPQGAGTKRTVSSTIEEDRVRHYTRQETNGPHQ